MDTNYEPEIAQENPFPGETLIADTQGKSSTSGNLTPITSKEKTFPKKRTAVELLSTALNTRSRKILEEFELQQSGGLKIGDFKEGLSGDVRITPNGITARNIAGLTTFAIDGDTGDAVFKGEVRSGSILTGGVIIEDENGQTIIDGIGLVSTSSFSKSDSSNDALAQVISSTATEDVTGATLNITLAREALVYFPFNIQGYIAGDADAHIFPNIGGVVPLAETMHIVLTVGNDALATYSSYHIALLPAGTTTYKLQANLSRDAGGELTITRYKMSYIVLGS